MPSIFLLQDQNRLLQDQNRLLQDRNRLVEMTEQPYECEALLQRLLAVHPSILAGDQFHGSEPKRWLLVGREVAVPDDDASLGRWSLDHLFVDQHRIPTFVEVKRSSDTRIRREVIGQMFDYAANAVTYWAAGQVRSHYERTCQTHEVNPDERLIAFPHPGGM